MDSGDHTLFLIFVILTGISVLLQVAVLLGLFISARKAVKAVHEVTAELKGSVIPTIHSTRALIERISPQVVSVTAGIAEITEAVRTETKDVKASFSELLVRIDRQTKHMDEIVTRSLSKVEHAGAVLESAVSVPVRQANGVMAAIKAVVGTYRSTVPRPRSIYDETRYTNALDSIDPEI